MCLNIMLIRCILLELSTLFQPTVVLLWDIYKAANVYSVMTYN